MLHCCTLPEVYKQHSTENKICRWCALCSGFATPNEWHQPTKNKMNEWIRGVNARPPNALRRQLIRHIVSYVVASNQFAWMGYAMDAIEGNGIVCLSAFIGRSATSPTKPMPQLSAHDSTMGSRTRYVRIVNQTCCSAWAVDLIVCARARAHRTNSNFGVSFGILFKRQFDMIAWQESLSGWTQHLPACSLFTMFTRNKDIHCHSNGEWMATSSNIVASQTMRSLDSHSYFDISFGALNWIHCILI